MPRAVSMDWVGAEGCAQAPCLTTGGASGTGRGMSAGGPPGSGGSAAWRRRLRL